MQLGPLTRRWFEAQLAELAPGAYAHHRAEGHGIWTLPESAGVRPWDVPWREVRKHPEDFEDPVLYKMSSRRTVVGPTKFGERVIVKRSLVRSARERAVSLVRPPKEAREFAVALQWRRIGILAPEPLMLAMGRDAASGYPSRYLVTRPLPEEARTARRYFRRKGFGGRRWDTLANYTADLLAKGAYHADFRADHIYFEKHPELGRRIWLIDLDGSRLSDRAPSRAELTRMLFQLFQSLVSAGLDDALATRFAGIAMPSLAPTIDATRILAEAREAHRLSKEPEESD